MIEEFAMFSALDFLFLLSQLRRDLEKSRDPFRALFSLWFGIWKCQNRGLGSRGAHFFAMDDKG